MLGQKVVQLNEGEKRIKSLSLKRKPVRVFALTIRNVCLTFPLCKQNLAFISERCFTVLILVLFCFKSDKQMNQSEQKLKQKHVTGDKRGKRLRITHKSRLVLLLIGRWGGARFFTKPSNAKPKQWRMPFDTQLKTTLSLWRYETFAYLLVCASKTLLVLAMFYIGDTGSFLH